MILDQLEYDTGQLDYLGQMWTWVSGESAPIVIVPGPFFCRALGTHQPGASATGTHQPGNSATGAI
jgi:hypothetical protein